MAVPSGTLVQVVAILGIACTFLGLVAVLAVVVWYIQYVKPALVVSVVILTRGVWIVPSGKRRCSKTPSDCSRYDTWRRRGSGSRKTTGGGVSMLGMHRCFLC
jgi:hypothetical protein